jgi:hypothetical protein
MPDQTGSAALIARMQSFPWKAWGEKFADDGFEQINRDLVTIAGDLGATEVGGTFDITDPFISDFLTSYVGERIVQLNDVTRDRVATLIRHTFEDGGAHSSFALGTKVLDVVRDQFEGYSRWRADRIARTETGIAYNHGNVLGYKANDVNDVDVEDGDDDEKCADANGETWSVEEALENPLEHPDCTRNFAPHLDDRAASDES